MLAHPAQANPHPNPDPTPPPPPHTRHTHHEDRWSAIYYVASGSRTEAGGHCQLLFRGGARQPHHAAVLAVSAVVAPTSTPPTSTPPASTPPTSVPAQQPSGTISSPLAVQDKPSATHTYMAISPVPGSLLLFPGSIPHCVLGTARPAAGLLLKSTGASGSPHTASDSLETAPGGKPPPPLAELNAPRISIAANFTKAIAPCAV